MTKTSYYRIFLLFAALILSGCGLPAPTPLSEARPIATDRVLNFQKPTDSRTARLVIVRDKGWTGSGCYTAIYVNGTLAARVNPKERVDLFVEPGEILLKVATDPMGRGLCRGGDWTQRETSIGKGETKFFRMTMDLDGRRDIIRGD